MPPALLRVGLWQRDSRPVPCGGVFSFLWLWLGVPKDPLRLSIGLSGIERVGEERALGVLECQTLA